MAQAKDEKAANTVVVVILLIIVIAFTWLGFFSKQPCDLDNIYLWCRLHPASPLQIAGVIGFYLFAFLLSGLWRNWVTLYNPENSSKWSLIFAAFGVVSLLLVWFG